MGDWNLPSDSKKGKEMRVFKKSLGKYFLTFKQWRLSFARKKYLAEFNTVPSQILLFWGDHKLEPSLQGDKMTTNTTENFLKASPDGKPAFCKEAGQSVCGLLAWEQGHTHTGPRAAAQVCIPQGSQTSPAKPSCCRTQQTGKHTLSNNEKFKCLREVFITSLCFLQESFKNESRCWKCGTILGLRRFPRVPWGIRGPQAGVWLGLGSAALQSEHPSL